MSETTRQNKTPDGPRHQRGASAVEFAFVFPVLFLLVYGVIVYSYIYVVQQSITYSAQQSAEAAVGVNPDPQGTLQTRVEERIQLVATQSLKWLPENQQLRMRGENGKIATVGFEDLAVDERVVRVTLRFRVPGLFPSLDLPLVGTIPPMPTQLKAEAIARI